MWACVNVPGLSNYEAVSSHGLPCMHAKHVLIVQVGNIGSTCRAAHQIREASYHMYSYACNRPLIHSCSYPLLCGIGNPGCTCILCGIVAAPATARSQQITTGDNVELGTWKTKTTLLARIPLYDEHNVSHMSTVSVLSLHLLCFCASHQRRRKT